MKAELDRRQGHTGAVEALFRSRPLQWINWNEIARVGGACAWRTRISDTRKRFKREGGSLAWNRSTTNSCYMFRPYVSLAPTADQYREQSLF